MSNSDDNGNGNGNGNDNGNANNNDNDNGNDNNNDDDNGNGNDNDNGNDNNNDNDNDNDNGNDKNNDNGNDNSNGNGNGNDNDNGNDNNNDDDNGNDNNNDDNNDDGNKKSRIIKKTQKVGEKVAKTIGVTGAITAVAAGGAKLALTAVGLSSAGPVAGSLAAGFQASMGNVVAGSAFSILQALAMGGVTTSILPIASGVGLLAGGYYWLKKSKL